MRYQMYTFWDEMMDEMYVKEMPAEEYVSPYMNEDVLVGEIVEDEHVQLPEIGA
jgi:hypothetical protein